MFSSILVVSFLIRLFRKSNYAPIVINLILSQMFKKLLMQSVHKNWLLKQTTKQITLIKCLAKLLLILLIRIRNMNIKKKSES